ncbi:universal stress protein [Kitasatospora sp. NPDC050463]|uniref:universal stress protein n=1 Tax=Kitasatospora sp. NPDC050463 TaxID=3155786 RepID=UPI00340545B7
MPRGRLRVYLGAAPGVGKTYDMLSEGQRRAGRGTDVVIAFMEDYGRPLTRLMAEGLETVPRKTVPYRGTSFTEMDLDAVLARRPRLALVDELAHTDVPGCRNTKRWQDVQELLDAGIDVISTVNIQHLESLNDVVEQITGVRQHETVPDDVVRGADQIELVDMSAEALRRRMAHGNIYPPEKIDAALAHFFRPGNLTALREIALLWAADRVEEALLRYRKDHGIQQPWGTRERVLVALSGGPEGDTLIRRAKRTASRGAGGEFLAVHVARDDGLTGPSPQVLARQRTLAESLGGTWHTLTGDNPARTVLAFAREINATQIVIGATRRSRLKGLFTRGTGEAIIEGSGDEIDVYVVTHTEAAHGRLLHHRAGRARDAES